MLTKLYVGGLSWGTNDEALKNFFSTAGTVVSASVIIDKLTGRSKGFGFVEMSTPEEAQKAVEMFNGQELDGRRLTVNEARPKPEGNFRPGQGGGYNRGGGSYGNRGGGGGFNRGGGRGNSDRRGGSR